MIHTNLSTRPFYNERAVNLWIVALGAVVALATLFNVSRARYDSGSNTELASQATQDEARAAEMRQTAARLRASVDARQIEAVSVHARQANDLIDRRTFSWTALFNRFEGTLPADVRITSIRPEIDRQHRIVLNVTVLARSVDDVNEFMERLDATHEFQELRSVAERTNDDDQIESALEMIYSPEPPPS
jgi:Tfp pilus assembly protein PilN